MSGTGGPGGGGLGGSGLGGSGGGGGEAIGVAQEADTLCCCTVPIEGGYMSCSLQASCPPYTTNTPGACGSGGGSICSASSLGPGAGGANAMDVLVLFIALAAFRAVRRRFA